MHQNRAISHGGAVFDMGQGPHGGLIAEKAGSKQSIGGGKEDIRRIIPHRVKGDDHARPCARDRTACGHLRLDHGRDDAEIGRGDTDIATRTGNAGI